MGSLGRKQGQAVKLVYVGAPGAEAVAVLIKDADDNTVTLKSTDRLVIDEIQFNTEATADATNLAYLIEAAATPTTPPSGGLGVIATFSLAANIGSQGSVFPGEGWSCAIGNTLFLLDDGNGWSGSNTALTGTGRIINGKTQGVQASAGRCLLTPGGTPGQNF